LPPAGPRTRPAASLLRAGAPGRSAGSSRIRRRRPGKKNPACAEIFGPPARNHGVACSCEFGVWSAPHGGKNGRWNLRLRKRRRISLVAIDRVHYSLSGHRVIQLVGCRCGRRGEHQLQRPKPSDRKRYATIISLVAPARATIKGGRAECAASFTSSGVSHFARAITGGHSRSSKNSHAARDITRAVGATHAIWWR